MGCRLNPLNQLTNGVAVKPPWLPHGRKPSGAECVPFSAFGSQNQCRPFVLGLLRNEDLGQSERASNEHDEYGQEGDTRPSERSTHTGRTPSTSR